MKILKNLIAVSILLASVSYSVCTSMQSQETGVAQELMLISFKRDLFNLFGSVGWKPIFQPKTTLPCFPHLRYGKIRFTYPPITEIFIPLILRQENNCMTLKQVVRSAARLPFPPKMPPSILAQKTGHSMPMMPKHHTKTNGSSKLVAESSPAHPEGAVYFGSDDGNVYCLE